VDRPTIPLPARWERRGEGILGLALALLLAACGGTAAPQAAGAPSQPASIAPPSASAAAGTTAVKVSYNTAAATDLPFLAAEQQGFFEGQKLAVTLVSMTPQVAITALSKGDIDFMNSPSNSVQGAANGLPFKIVWDSWDGSAWSLVGKAEYSSVAQLRGKVVATNNPGTAPYAFLRAGLKNNGLAVSDVQFLPLAGTSAVYAALLAGKIDAGILSPPFVPQAVEQGYREIAFLGDLLELPSNGLSTRTDYIAAHRPVVEAMIRAMLQAEDWLKANPDAATALVAKDLKTSPSVAKATYERMRPLLTKNGETSTLGVQQNIELLEEASGKKITMPPSQFGDFGPLHDVLTAASGRASAAAPGSPSSGSSPGRSAPG
jgi:NitT/TauT family transport system substrate-binding protein